MPLAFSCTGCGRCCHDLRLPLSLAEALAWIGRGGTVELLCDAAADTGHAPDDPVSAYHHHRGFAALSGTLPIRVRLQLIASFAGPCPHLGPDMACTAYEARPAACRIYPAEVIPLRAVEPAAKLCPPEAWVEAPETAQVEFDATTRDAVATHRARSLVDVACLPLLAVRLGIDVVALRNEGYAVHRLAADRLAEVLRMAMHEPPWALPRPDTGWRFTSPRAATRDMIAAAGATLASPTSDAQDYLPLFAAA